MPRVFRRQYRDPNSGRVTKTGTYYFWLCRNGKKAKVSTGTTNYNLARRIASKESAAANLSGLVTRSQSVSSMIDAYLEDRQQEVSAHHFRNITGILRTFSAEVGHRKVAHVTPQAVQAFLLTRLNGAGRVRSNSTYNRHLQAVRSMFNWGVRRGFVAENPAASSHLPNRREEERPRECFTSEELSQLFRTSRDTYRTANGTNHRFPLFFHAFLRTAYHTAARRGELERMRWNDIDWHERRIVIPVTKTGRFRSVSFHPSLQDVLQSYRGALLKLGVRVGETNRVFVTDKGGPINNLNRLFYKLSEVAGVECSDRGLGYHAIRHTSLTHMARNGASVHILKEIAGHRRLSTTERYLHADEGLKREAAATLEPPGMQPPASPA